MNTTTNYPLWLVACAVLMWPALVAAETPLNRDALEKAHKAYRAQDYESALKSLLDAQIDTPNSAVLDYHLGNVYFRMERFDDAAQAYSRALRTDDKEQRFNALYNLGNTAFKQGRYKEAIEFYNQALNLKPDDEDAKHNLEYVREEIRRMLEKQKEQQKQQQQQNKQCNNPQQGDQQQQQQQQKQQGENQQQDQQKQQAQDKNQQQQDQQQQQKQEQGQQGQQGQPEKKESDGNSEQDKAAARPQPAKPDKDGNSDQQAGKTPRPGQLKPLSKEEAEQLLRRLQEKPPQRAVPGGRRYRPQKDW